MTPAELFSLPPGTRVEYSVYGLSGYVVAVDLYRVTIHFDDGSELELPRVCEHVAEFAGGIELVPADVPLIAGH